MILNSRDAAVAYRCPYCGMNTVSVVGIFALSGEMIKLKCACRKSELTISYTPDRKVRVSVPCLVCPSAHNFVISSNTFFEKKILTLSCPYSGVDICFIGGIAEVEKALAASDAELNKMLEEAELDSFGVFKTDRAFNNPQVEEVARYMISEFCDEGKLTCECGDHKISSYGFELTGDHVNIFCRTCGASAKIPMSSVIDADDFLRRDELVLKKKRKKAKPPDPRKD